MSIEDVSFIGHARLVQVRSVISTCRTLKSRHIRWHWPMPSFFVQLYNYAWFVGFGLAFVIYLVLAPMEKTAKRR